MKKLLAFLLVFTLGFVLYACGDDEDENGDDNGNGNGNGEVEEFIGTGYGLVHGHYVGISTVEVDEDGVVIEATLDEYFLPYSWASVEVDEEAEEAPEDVVVWERRGSTNWNAKYVDIGGILFEATSEDGAAPVYSAPGIPDLEAWLKLQPNAKWYVEQVDAGNFFIANADGSESDYPLGEEEMRKWDANYWRFGDLGWDGNVEQTIEAVVGMNLSEKFELERGEDNFWTIGDAVSGATWSDMPDYIEVILRAYYNALND